ncbi:hypothetical protein CRUP_029784 [Coryphaenoides rupestris]|nr:hypothetical protein CRUP_029784 [Coryphaenoides rupestris]
MTLLDVWLSRSLPMWLLLQSLVLMALCFPSASMCPKGCVCQRFDLHHLHVHHQGLNVNCSHSRLKEIPGDLPVDTVVLRLDRNQITAVPDRVFRGLGLLRDLNLSYNAVETLGEGAFSGVEATLQVLDLSHNRIASVHKDAFARLKARVVVDDNPWHCDCALQQAIGGMAHNHEAAARVLCRSSELRDQEGEALLGRGHGPVQPGQWRPPRTMPMLEPGRTPGDTWRYLSTLPKASPRSRDGGRRHSTVADISTVILDISTVHLTSVGWLDISTVG